MLNIHFSGFFPGTGSGNTKGRGLGALDEDVDELRADWGAKNFKAGGGGGAMEGLEGIRAWGLVDEAEAMAAFASNSGGRVSLWFLNGSVKSSSASVAGFWE